MQYIKTIFRRWPLFFAGVQLTGLVCMWTWPYVPSFARSFVWGAAILALFPGNFLSSILMDKLFWKSGLSLTAMSVAGMPVLVAMNAALWFGVIGALRRLLGRRSY